MFTLHKVVNNGINSCIKSLLLMSLSLKGAVLASFILILTVNIASFRDMDFAT